MSSPAPRSIVHLDADAFFASVEQAADARLRGKPVAVGGERRGIIASASYEARRLGIYTPMPTAIARRLCPKLIVLPGDFDKYELFSRLMFSYAYDFTPDVEIGSIDEGYFDLTGTRKPAVDIAETIRRAIRQSLKLSVSEGIASNKLVSQIASKLKKPSAFQWVPPGRESSFLAPLSNQWLPGIGPQTAGHLKAAGLVYIGQIAQTPTDQLSLLVGRLAAQLHRFAHGLDDRPIIPVRAPAKSYSEQETFAADTTDAVFLEATLRRMADQLLAKVRADTKSVRTLTVKIRYNDMDEAQSSASLTEPTDLETDIYATLAKLLRQNWQRRVSLRLISLKLSNVYDGRFRSGLALDTDARRHEAQQRLTVAVDELRHKFGRAALLRGHDFALRARQGQGQEPGSESPVQVRPHADPGGGRVRGQTQGATDSQPAVAGRGLPLAGTRQHLGQKANPPSFQPFPRRVSTSYVPLNVHSYYSFLDSTLSIDAIVNLAKQHEFPAVALTDRHNLHGAVEFAQAAAQAGIKPIIGAELDWNGQRLCLYVENSTGYANLCRLLSRKTPTPLPGPMDSAADTGAGDTNHRSESEAAASRRFSRGVTGTVSVAGELFGGLALENAAGLIAVSPMAELARFFPNRFYLEIHSREAWDRRPASLPCVAVAPVHYAVQADRWKYDIVQSIRTLTLLRQPHPAKRRGGQYHLRTVAELQPLLSVHPELAANTIELADRCTFAFSLGQPQFPSYSPMDGSAPAAFLRRLVLEGLQRRYPQDHPRLKAQVEEELGIVNEVGYAEYFLVMWDILQECARRGIDWITRGSAADSLACYCLGISSVCPVRFDLYFRRFLNKDRMALNKLPDIDVDFPHDRKDDVIDLIFEKYGANHAAIVGGFSTFQCRSAFAEVAKVLGVSEFQVRRLTERLPHFTPAAELAAVIATTQECRELPFDQEPYSTALQMGQFLAGFPRYPKMHPCGLVLSRQPMHELTPCFRSAKGYPTTHFDMESIETIGLVKMDILAQGGLAVMRDVMRNPRFQEPRLREIQTSACELPPSPRSAEPDFRPSSFDLSPWNDPAVWALIASGEARAVHHIESPAMISLCKMCAVHDIDTLIAIVSVIRPGAANENKKMEFARRYQGLSPVRYPHPSLAECLRSTYGLVVYEEHILQICEAFAGLPPGRADVLRRALGKEKTAVISQIQTEFADCARRHNRTESEIAEVWELVAGFRGYAFCKAHSTAYGVEAYQSAWLKRYYPAEFLAAVLTNGKGFYHPLVYVLECHRLGIPLLPPSVNEPGPAFTVVYQAAPPPTARIRVPVLRVKGLTQRTQEALLDERARGEFVSLADFFFRVQPSSEEMESLIQVGAFDGFGAKRTTQFWEYKSLGHQGNAPLRSVPASAARAGHCAPQQLWLFPPPNGGSLPTVPLIEPNRQKRLQAEEEYLGYPASGHPLELFPDIAWETYCPINRLGEHLGETVVTCGLVIEQRLFHQITGEPMKFLTIADWTGIIETELFARAYQSYGLNTVRYRVLEIAATVEPFENGRGFSLRVWRAGKPRTCAPTHCGLFDNDKTCDVSAQSS